MESFYSQWLKQNKKDNETAQQNLQQKTPEPITTDETSEQQNIAQVEQNLSREIPSSELERDMRSDLIYKNNNLALYIEKGSHIHQIKFRLQDHLFYMKIKLIDSSLEPPLLRDILQFLETAFNFILDHVKKFYNIDDHNIAFLTLHQKPMISGLNTGAF
jgi:hypothetical protein